MAMEHEQMSVSRNKFKTALLEFITTQGKASSTWADRYAS
jgi:hypothetical protein